MFLGILLLIHLQAREKTELQTGNQLEGVSLPEVQELLPNATWISEQASADGSYPIKNEAGDDLGYALQTSPLADHLIGFSGPTNVLIVVSADDTIRGLQVLWSRDTRDHVEQVLEDESFLPSFIGLAREDSNAIREIDGVSGATLTSLAIQESILLRLSGSRASLRFPEPLSVAIASELFDTAFQVQQDDELGSLWHVFDQQGTELGTVLRTSPEADNVAGFQGPTETWIGIDRAGKAVGIRLGKSYDNEEYVSYVRDDRYFLKIFNEMTLGDIAALDPIEDQLEGVSGATMTSMAVTDGIILAAASHIEKLNRHSQEKEQSRHNLPWSARDYGTGIVVLLGVLLGLSRLRGNRILRLLFQFVLIGYLGLVNGDMLSQAMVVGWAQNGVPWKNAGGLVLLSLAALIIPITTKHNVYCSHICPHGAAQQLLKNRLRWKLRLNGKLSSVLNCLPGALLFWCVFVGMCGLGFSLVDIEPFDAWVFTIAGTASIVVAIVGLVASLFVPMAYCRFGCPTGMMLGYLRRNAGSGTWAVSDWCALGLLLLALGVWAGF